MSTPWIPTQEWVALMSWEHLATLGAYEPRPLRWHVCDSLTGNIVGRLIANSYEIAEDVRASTIGTLTVPMPSRPEGVRRLNQLISPSDRYAHGRAIAMEDVRSGKVLFYGPIMQTPERNGPVLSVTVNDWSSWFRSAVVRPTGAKYVTKRDYVVTGRDQGLIMTDLFKIALGIDASGNPLGRPAIVVDDAPAASKNRDKTVRMFGKIGEALDELASTDGGVEWFTYGTRAPRATQVIGHVAAAYPERGSGNVPIRLSWKQDLAGNISGNLESFRWPGGEDTPTRVFATDANEEVALWGYDQSTTLGATDIAWDALIDLADGTTDKATATARAKGELKRSASFDGLVEVTVPLRSDGKGLGFETFGVGDRARLEIDDSWNRTVNTAAARITRRVLSGGFEKPTTQVLTIDLDDDTSPFTVGLPGSPVGA